MKKHIIAILCIFLADAALGIISSEITAVDCIALGAVAFAVYGAALYTVRRKKRGGCSGCCSGCAYSGKCQKSETDGGAK